MSSLVAKHYHILTWADTQLKNSTQVPVASGRGESGRESVGDGVPTAKLLLLLLRELWEEAKQREERKYFLMQCNYNQHNHPEEHVVLPVFHLRSKELHKKTRPTNDHDKKNTDNLKDTDNDVYVYFWLMCQ